MTIKDLTANAEAVAELSARVVPHSAINGRGYKIIVDGEKRVANWWLAASEIVFKEGGVLIFDKDAISRRKELFIVCKKLTVESGIGRITWDREVPPAPADRGQAPAGSAGQGPGAGGVAGGGGQAGADGNIGMTSPDLSFFVQEINGAGNLEIDFAGGDGGGGGLGQIGGTGGAGARGTAAEQERRKTPLGTIWLPSCAAGPGRGGNGGPGGPGGNGGTGGIGGRGGTVTICAASERIPTIRNMVNIKNDGGTGGPGGNPGAGGQGGPGGSEGQLASFCNSAGRDGAAGAPGGMGSQGNKGEPGEAGAQFDTHITDEQFEKLFPV